MGNLRGLNNEIFQGLGAGQPDNERCRSKAFSTGLSVWRQPEGSSSEIFYGASVRGKEGERRRA